MTATALRLSYAIKLRNGGDVVCNTYSRSRRRIIYRIRALRWQTGTLRVSYIRGDGTTLVNEADVRGPAEMLDVMNAFDDARLLEFVAESDWS